MPPSLSALTQMNIKLKTERPKIIDFTSSSERVWAALLVMMILDTLELMLFLTTRQPTLRFSCALTQGA
jgi:hypothetical protein